MSTLNVRGLVECMSACFNQKEIDHNRFVNRIMHAMEWKFCSGEMSDAECVLVGELQQIVNRHEETRKLLDQAVKIVHSVGVALSEGEKLVEGMK